MKLYVEMNEQDFEIYKQHKAKARLSDYPVAELCNALLEAIETQGGRVDKTANDGFAWTSNTAAKTIGQHRDSKTGAVITLVLETK